MDGDFWERSLGKPKLVVAPMVDASELAWRLLSRRHGAQLCYTPMLHSCVFTQNPRYRMESLQFGDGDRPLIVQFCGNKPEILLEAALLAQPHCDAIDINIGCPQSIAKRGHYGAFLQDEWPLLSRIVSTLRKSLRVPVTCKIRIYEDIEKTVEYAKMLESAGCQLLAVHGRTKEQKGPLTGLASWDHIRAVKENVSIPVIANGNIQCLQDVYKCMSYTNCDGVMSAEGNLYNPAIFESRYPPSWEMALEYLQLVEEYPCPLSYIRGHLFKIFHHVMSLPENRDLRSALASQGTVVELRRVAEAVRDRYKPYHDGEMVWKGGCGESYNLELPPWLCKPYVRPPPEEHLKKLQEIQMNEAKMNSGEIPAKRFKTEDGTYISKKMSKKLQRHPEKVNQVRRVVVICKSSADCPNPMGLKCSFSLCKTCCRAKCYQDDLDCRGHGILIKTRREKARLFSSNEIDETERDVNGICRSEDLSKERRASNEEPREMPEITLCQKTIHRLYHSIVEDRRRLIDNPVWLVKVLLPPPCNSVMTSKSESKEKNENESEKEGYAGYDLYPDRRSGGKSDPESFEDYALHSRSNKDKFKCESRVIKAFRQNPLLRILYHALKEAGCPFDITRHVSCEECDTRVTGGYDSEWNQVVVCQNQIRGSYLCTITLVHELIHMYDYCTGHVDFRNLEHLACTEIRAANLSHCSFMSSFFLGQSSLFDIKATHQYCVKMKATQSLMVARKLNFDTAFKIVAKVFDKCYNDLEPIGRRVRRNSTDHDLAYREFKHYKHNL